MLYTDSGILLCHMDIQIIELQYTVKQQKVNLYRSGYMQKILKCILYVQARVMV